MRIRTLVFILLLLHFSSLRSMAQLAGDSSTNDKISQQYISVLSNKSDRITNALDKQSAKYLAKLEKQEKKLKRKVSKIDSLAAQNIFANSEQQYQHIQEKVKTKSDHLLNKTGKYIPWLDSATTSLKFLATNNSIISANGQLSKVKGAMTKVKALENEIKQAGSIKEFIHQRKAYLTEQLKNYNLGNDLKQYNQTAYYYSQQLNEYKQMMNDPEKAERKALALLNQTKLFKDFFRNNSQLASLFNLPGSTSSANTATALPGLQTRDEINNLIQGRIASGGAGAQQQVQQSIEQAQGELQQLKNKIGQLGKGGSDADMPEGFKPNPQKTKSFLKRIDLGVNIQSQKANGYFPVVSDIGLSAGYKLNDKSIVGIGASYKIGFGQNIQHIKITSQGVGLRSFIDWKIKGSFWLSGGYEMNYNDAFNKIEQLQIFSAWQRSGLIGISKQVSLKTKVFKNTRVQLLWDLLSYYQIPKTQPLLFRIGYSLK